MSDTQQTDAPEKLGFWAQVRSFSSTFWTANLMEMLERLAYFGVRAVVGLYIVDAASNGGLELTHIERGTIFTVWALIQTLLPMFTGGYSDRYGYKVSLLIAFSINAVAYVLMGLAHSYVGFFGAVIMLATGTAIFKPPLHGTLAHSVEEKNSSVGWAFFYQLVNIGGFVGPFIAGKMRVMDWSYVFYASAAITLLNFLPTLFILKDLSKEVREQKRRDGVAQDTRGPVATFVDSISTLVKDTKFMVFLLIFSGFWLGFMQLFDTLPIFIEEWVDSRSLLAWLHSHGITFINADRYGNVPPEMMINLDAGTIVILMPLIGYITGKFKPIVMMVVGMAISSLALILAGSVTIGIICLLGIFLFAIGEMACSPKFSEYIGLMAPPEKKALYMGYSNVPFAIGWTFAGMLSGIFYGAFSDKYKFARDYMVNHLKMDQVLVTGLDRTDVMPTLAGKLGVDTFQAARVLWDVYHPWITWALFGAIGLVATLAMLVYHFWLEADMKKRAALDAAAG
ncbi:MAG TPA: MFS transporter [Bacteroidetes bacterium]|nr:MFS transporter [Bacteroidota bacterium]